MTVIDVFSKYAWVVPIKNKSAESCRDAFALIFSNGRRPQFVYSDWGNEFKGVCKKLLHENNIVHIDSRSVHKAAVVERFNRTLKEKMWRFMSFGNSKKYIEKLDEIVEAYNNTFHRSIGTKPVLVTKEIEPLIRRRLYGDEIFDYEDLNGFKTSKLFYKKGQYVRLANEKNIFEKGYTPNWSKEIYTIYAINLTDPPTYKIESPEGVKYEWSYYKEELQAVSDVEYPYDTFRVLGEKNRKVLIKKLNSQTQEEHWIDKSLLS
jgi:hypothetical protein